MLFGSSGIRRKFDDVLIETALKVGSALAYRSSTIVVGMDTRTTSPLLSNMVISGILGSGGTAFTAGVAPTPSIAFYTRNAGAGCMVTASHNPEEYNGLKLLNPDGSSFTRPEQDAFEKLLETYHWSDWKHQGHAKPADAIKPHKTAILDAVSIKENMPVILDCGNGAGCALTPTLLADAGAKPVLVNCEPSGTFGRPSEPLEENLPHIGDMVRKRKSACAVVHDGDADRMMAFDGRGRYISGDQMLMLFAKYLGAKNVVTTSDASMAIEEIADVHRTAVGDTFVSEELRVWGDFGGEPSGAWIFPKISYCPDGPFAAALFCEIASEWNIEKEIDAMPAYPILRESMMAENARQIVTALGADSPTDGIRISDESGWYLIRASGTEPKVRITAEAKTKSDAKLLLEKARDRIKEGKKA